MLQTEIRVKLVKPIFDISFRLLHRFIIFVLKELICVNGKHDWGRKITSPEFFSPVAQTNRLLEHNNTHNNTVAHDFFT